MTTRQHLFCHHLCQGKPARAAAISAGYALTTINQNLIQLLRSTHVQAHLERHIEKCETEYTALIQAFNLCGKAIDDPLLDIQKRLAASRLLLRILTSLRRCLTSNLSRTTSLGTGLGLNEIDPDNEQLQALDQAHAPRKPMHYSVPNTPPSYPNGTPIILQRNTNETIAQPTDNKLYKETPSHDPAPPTKTSFL